MTQESRDFAANHHVKAWLVVLLVAIVLVIGIVGRGHSTAYVAPTTVSTLAPGLTPCPVSDYLGQGCPQGTYVTAMECLPLYWAILPNGQATCQ